MTHGLYSRHKNIALSDPQKIRRGDSRNALDSRDVFSDSTFAKRHRGSFLGIAFKKHGARLPGTRGASFRGRLRGEWKAQARVSGAVHRDVGAGGGDGGQPPPESALDSKHPREGERGPARLSRVRDGAARRGVPVASEAARGGLAGDRGAARRRPQAQPKKRPKAPAPTEPLNEYEREREARIARNKLMLDRASASRPTPTRSWRARRALRRKRNAHPLGRLANPRNAGRTRARPRCPRARRARA